MVAVAGHGKFVDLVWRGEGLLIGAATIRAKPLAVLATSLMKAACQNPTFDAAPAG